MEKNISIVIPTKNREPILNETFEWIAKKQSYPLDKLEIILINDGEIFKTNYRGKFPMLNIKICKNMGTGAAAAKNTGIANASFEMLLFLDDDMLIRDDHIFKHMEVHEKYPDILVGGRWENSPDLVRILESTTFGKYKLKNDYNVLTNVILKRIDEDLHNTNSLAGFNMSVKKDTIKAIGCFDEGFPFTGFEDREFSMRALNKGYKLIYHEKALLYHNELDRADMENWLARKSSGNVGFVLLAEMDEALKKTLFYQQFTRLTINDLKKFNLRKLIIKAFSNHFIIKSLKTTCFLLEKLNVRFMNRLLHFCYTSLYLGYAQIGFSYGVELRDQLKYGMIKKQ